MADIKSFDIYGSSRRATAGQIPIDQAISQALTNYGAGVQSRLSGKTAPAPIDPAVLQGLIANAAGNTLTNWNRPVAKKTTKSASKTTTSGAVTPASIAAKMTQAVGAQRAATPEAAATAQQSTVDPLAQSNAAIQSAYSPILDFYTQQAQQTQDRYAQNAANLKNIFGALTGLTAADTKRINDQFTSSVTKQQSDLAARTAEQRAAQTAGETQLAATAAERGNGPALGGSQTQQATEQAIGQANAIQSNWEGLMGAQQANAITDVTNRGAGYGQQEIAANAQLAQNLQDALSAISGQKAGIEGQIAQAKVARDQAIAGNQFDMAMAAQKQIDALQLQASKNTGLTDVAKIRANATLAAKRLGGGSSGTTKVPASEAIKARADKINPRAYSVIQNSAAQAYNQAYALLNPTNAPAGTKVKTPTAADVKAAWQGAHTGNSQLAPLANDYIDSAYK